MNKKKSIGIMSWSLNGGGAERAVANLSRDLSDKYDVYIILFDANNITYPYCGTIIDMGIPMGSNKLQKAMVLYKRCRKLKSIKRQYEIHTVISFMPHINLYNILTKGSDKAIISIRNNMSQRPMPHVSKLLMNLEGKKAEVTVSLSEGVREDLIKNFHQDPEKIVTIYNSCDINWLTRDCEEVDTLIATFDFTTPVIVTVGRLTYQKGQWHLLRAMSIVKETIPNFKLVIFGQGEYLSELQEYARKLGVAENCFFLGYVKNHHKFMKKCDVFVFPSLFEGLGNVLLEALACEMPIVSTDCLSGPMEILDDKVDYRTEEILMAKYGILVPGFTKKDFFVDDIEFERSDYLLAEAILNVLQDVSIRDYYKKQAALRIKDFAPDKVKQQWIDIIEE